MGHSSSEDSDREHYRYLNHAEKMERKRRKRMLKHAHRHNPGFLQPIGQYGYAESSHHGLIGNLTDHHHHHHGHGHQGGLIQDLTGHNDRYDHYAHHGGRRPGGLISLIGGVASALVGGHQRSRSAPPVPDVGYNNNQPGFPEARQYPAPGHPPADRVQGYRPPGYPPQDSVRGSGSFLEPGYPSLDQGPRSFPEPRHTDDQFVPYRPSRSEKSAGSAQQEYTPPPGPPPAYSVAPQSAPPSGFRVPLNTTTNFFPPPSELGTPPCFNIDGSPLYFGSALFPRSVHPCKVGTHLGTHVLVVYGGREQAHSGRYDLLPFSPQTMELVRTSRGQIPPGRRPVEGGHEENEAKLYHAVATLRGVRVPGKTGSHLGGAMVGFEGEQLVVTDDYEILCWK